MSRFIAIEGIDGSGKGTQTAELQKHYEQQGLRCSTITFPRYSETMMGKQIGRFLNGEFGPLEHLHPVPISLMYAVERFESRALIEEKLNNCDILISDRYVGSNLAHQGAHLSGEEQQEFLDWISKLEFELFGVPQPDLVIVLDLPAESSADRVAMKKARDYTDQVTDLHESNQEYLAAVHEVYRMLCQQKETWHLAPCMSPSGEGLSVDLIQKNLRELINKYCPE
ncbi:MAG: dTMP kinase [Planctomycetaceae bacterium]|nr:dTMP kinase [Planctomycetaceae bacterium]